MTIRLWDSAGNVTFDVDTIAQSGVCLGTYEVAANTAFSQSFPGYTGSTVRAFNPTGDYQWNATVDTALGYPRVTVPAVPGAYFMSIWALTKPSFTGGTGLWATRADQSALVLSPDGFGLYYLGDASVTSTVPNSGSISSTGDMGWHVMQFNSSVPIIPVLEVLDGYYTEMLSFTRLSATSYQIIARRCAISTTDGTGFRALSTPRVLCYGRVTTAIGPPYFAIYKSTNELAWDLRRGQNSMLGGLAIANFTSSSGTQFVTINNNSETWGVIGGPGGFRRQGTQVSATWRMQTFRRMFTRTTDGRLSVQEVSASSYLADSNESNPFFGAPTVIVTKHTGI